MKVALSGTVRRFITLFEEETEATIHDYLVSDDRVVFLVAADDMATATGPGGWTVQLIERQFDRTVELIGDADTSEASIASAFAPAAVRRATLSRQNDTVVYVEIAKADRGVAIDASGETIDTTCELTRCHYDIDDI